MGFLLNPALKLVCQFSSKKIMKYLNVAEKNDAAKNIAAILSRGNSNRREGLSPYNKIYEFDTQVLGEQCDMVMTSVSGHLLNYAFDPAYKSWHSTNPVALFDAPIQKVCPEQYQNIKRTLEREARSCHGLIIWTDCDREGENIGFEIINVCTAVKPTLAVYRAKFSEITAQSIFRALNTLGQANKNVSDAVDVRQELDLRTGAAFTRLQTLRFSQSFPDKLANKVISYGSCQFPTLGFVVDRYQAIENFIAENFWRLKMSHTVKELTTDFNWKRDRLFDKNACEAILDICKLNPTATVESVESKPKNKWRPLPLDTVEMEKNISRKLKINAKETMRIAEKLYNQGLISYPRTETNIFPKELNLTNLVEQQHEAPHWGAFAQRILNEGGPNPRQGKKSDQAHPPIHPIKYVNNLTGNDARVYEYIVRHFLACVHKDAQGFETIVECDIAGEKFTAKGLLVLEKNYLEVYIYEKWNGKEINNYEQGQQFTPTVLDIVESVTKAPNLLTEADLINLMDKHGIGTDATHAEHIDTIKSREYVGLHENIYFVPGTLGMGLIEGYNNIGLEISLAKPILRSDFESDLKLICDGLKDPEVVRREQIEKYKAVYQKVMEKINEIDVTLANRLGDQPQVVADQPMLIQEVKPILKCPKCGADMILKSKRNGPGLYISCQGYPACKNSIWLPQNVETVSVLDESCPDCGPNVKQLKIKFRTHMFPGEPNPNIYCIGGCDQNVLDTFDIPRNKVRQNPANNQFQDRTIMPPPPPPNINRPPTPQNNINNSRRPPPANNLNNTFQPQQPPPPNTSRFNGNTTGGAPAEEDIVCHCNVRAVLLTVRKEGPNKGRKFHKCQSGTCDFFLWGVDEGDVQIQLPNRPQQNAAPRGNLKCQCNLPVVQRTVQKAGPNIGRTFYCCSKPFGQGCKYFKWCDEADGGGGDGGGGGGGGGDDDDGGGGGGGGRRKRNTTNKNKTAPYTRAKRKCGKCGQEGHTKTKCPNG